MTDIIAVKPLLVGESNPYSVEPNYPKYALYPYPENSAGGRLCFKVLGLTRREYLARFDRVNLCAGKWSMREAKERARAIENEWATGGRTIVLLGAKVCSAFNVKFHSFERHVVAGQGYVILPHPSGLSRAWNEPGAYERARAVLKEAGVL